ncbi:MAG: hypothetical protein U1F34_02845 [Gammaproteobacteria bacterium]
MTYTRILLVMTLGAIVSACTIDQVYGGLQQREQLQCQQPSQSEREQCLQQSSGDYETYKEHRDAEVKSGSTP